MNGGMNMSEKNSKLSEDDMRMISEMMDGWQATADRRKNFLKEKGEDIMSRIVATIEEKGNLNDDDFAYRPEQQSVTSDEFFALFNAVEEYAGGRYFTDDAISFSNHSLFMRYNGKLIEFFTMSGQGSYSLIGDGSETSVEFDSFNVGKIMEFEDFKRDVLDNR
jgi:hypothetical protein